jgi:peptidoglycan LD-endopeptidase CwlK
MKNSRDLADLRPVVRAKAEKFVRQCAAVGIDVLITSTLRDNESQGALYAQGRSAPGPRVTNAKPGESFHNYGVAFDFVPIVAGKAQWDDIKTFTRCGEIGEACGLEWAGRWRSFKELAHLQEPGLTIAALKAGA